MKKLLPILVLGLLIPQFVLAAWWNPFSWNWKALFSTPSETPVEEVALEEVDELIPTTIETEPVVEKASVMVQDTPVPVSKPSIVQPTITPTSSVEPAPVFLIQNVRNEVTEELATITWETSVPAQSQLILDSGNGKGYESAEGVGISHKVYLADPVSSIEYNYKIIARSNDGKTVDYYGSFNGKRKFSASSTTKDNCRVIYVKDLVGEPAIGMEVKVSGTYGSSNVAIATFEEKTDKYGEIELEPYCNISSMKLKVIGEGFETRLTIQNGTTTTADTEWDD